MTNYKLTHEDLLELLKEQRDFINSSLSNFLTNEIEAKRLATTIRVLVHDTSNSASLLKLLDKKDKIEFINSASSNDGRLHSMTGMVGVRGSNSNQYFGLVAKINKESKFLAVPLFQQHLPQWYESYTKVSFENWWNMEIINIKGIGLTREDLVLNVANKDGSAHVEKTLLLPEKYQKAKMSKLALNINGTETEFERNVVYASIAQIGWELLSSVNEFLKTIF